MAEELRDVYREVESLSERRHERATDAMKQTPVHESHNPDLLNLMPPTLKRIIEMGCSSGALAREYKKINPGCEYVGVEVSADYAELARRHCDRVVVTNLDAMTDAEFDGLGAANCWIFGDVLEHLRDPWAVLTRIGKRMAKDDCVIACIPNMQHWSVQATLMSGHLFYQDSGLFDRTHLRWFTRATILDLFTRSGLQIVSGTPRIFDNSRGAAFIAAIRTTAAQMGLDAELAVQDALPMQYVVKAVPAQGRTA
jgi:2-polyprenyl-3-methyl-5-hydroxy-6-metoxy-1,4-benzoquinol methylase